MAKSEKRHRRPQHDYFESKKKGVWRWSGWWKINISVSCCVAQLCLEKAILILQWRKWNMVSECGICLNTETTWHKTYIYICALMFCAIIQEKKNNWNTNSPVLDLTVPLPTVCPSKSYWFNRELSPSTTTEFEAFFVQVYVTSVFVYASMECLSHRFITSINWPYNDRLISKIKFCRHADWRWKVFHSQLPNLRGQEWKSMGKSSRCIGHSACTVNLWHKSKHTP